MKREVVELVEAARGLGVRVAPKPGNLRNIRIAGDRKEFPDRLYRVAQALEAVDRAGSQSLDGVEDSEMDAARLRMALDGVFRWMRSVGMDITQPHAVVANALAAHGKAAGKRYRPVPQFAHDGFKKNTRPKPLLKLDPGPGERISLDMLRAKAFQAIAVEQSLGAVMAH